MRRLFKYPLRRLALIYTAHLLERPALWLFLLLTRPRKRF